MIPKLVASELRVLVYCILTWTPIIAAKSRAASPVKRKMR